MNASLCAIPLRVLVVGLGNMGLSHALAYHKNPAFEIVGLVNRSTQNLPKELSEYSCYQQFDDALFERLTPDLVSINTYTDTHAAYAIKAMEAGAHVFVEKPLAETVSDAESVVACAKRLGKKLVVGYILRHHPGWVRLVQEAKKLGGPYVFRLNLNQRSFGKEWETHKQLMKTTSPIVDCGVHYVDVMCQVTPAKAVRVNGIGLRLSEEIDPNMYNYGQLQVQFDDGSVGWYEAGWGPMMSDTAHFVKDIVTPQGALSIAAGKFESSDIESHTRVGNISIQHASGKNEFIALPEEPGHQALCDLEQAYVAKVILEDIDVSLHNQEAVQSLAICLAADESIRTGTSITLETQ